jgi:hypothetical protein
MLALSDPLWAPPPISDASSPEQNKRPLLLLDPRLVNLTWGQAADEEAHPLPPGFLAWQVEKFTALVRR